uniref:Uncharacterized protein n=1 Tax=Neogobius melanostomus TaxID=47308 RepID=A0A8C6S7I2_9GOBI
VSGNKSLMETPHNATRVLAYTLKDRDLGKLHKAASVGDVDKLIDLIICQKKDIDKVDRKHRTALHIACAMGHVEVVKFLAEVRADLNLCDGQNRTALMKAVQGQNERCVSVLLENHAEVHIADIDGNTALHLAAHSKSVSIARLLLTQDVNINALNNEGLSALSVAVRIDAKHADNIKKLPLIIATANEMHAMTQLLLGNLGWKMKNQNLILKSKKRQPLIVSRYSMRSPLFLSPTPPETRTEISWPS